MFNNRYNILFNNNPINDILSSYPNDQIRPFKLNWLNSAHLETLLPGSNWETVYDIIIPAFCEKINSQFLHEIRKQALFELLGKSFVSRHFPSDNIDVTITKPPFISTEESLKLYEDSSTWLNLTLERIIKERGIYNKKTKDASNDMKNYINQANDIFNDHFNKELSKKEAEYLKNISTSKRHFRPPNTSLHHKPETIISSVSDQNLPDSVEPIFSHGPEMMIAPPPHCTSFQSEFFGLALANVCQQNEEETLKVCKEMCGRRLPISLRKNIWKNVLFETESPIFNKNINFEELIREKFSRAVTRGISDLKISKEISTPVNELLENLIIEQFEKCLPLTKFDVEFQSEAVKILNILYVYDRSYDRHLIFWLFPLLYGLKDEADGLPVNKTPFLYEMALYLNLLQNIYPPWVDIFVLAENVILKLSNLDSKFVDHLLNIAQKNVISQSKEFLVQIMDLEKIRTKKNKTTTITAKSILNNKVFKKINSLYGSDLIKSPIIFIRKWIGEGFVSILKNEAVLYIFDQLFMEKFSSSVFQDACLAIILLLKNEFLKAEDHASMKNVFLSAPHNLLSLDIIRAWSWIHRGGDLAAVPKMNRRELYPAPVPAVEPISRPASVTPIFLPHVAINDIKLKLILPLFSNKQKSFANDFKQEDLSVSLTMCLEYNDIRIEKIKSYPLFDSEFTSENGTVIKNFKFEPDDLVDFHKVDVSYLSNQYEDGFKFSILARVKYRDTEDKEITLGWCTIKCFLVQEMEAEAEQLQSSELLTSSSKLYENMLKEHVSKLVVRFITEEVPIINGDVPENYHIFQNEQDDNSSGYLLKGSLLGIHLFDPENIPPTPPPKTPIEEVIPIVQKKRKPIIRRTRKVQPPPGKSRPNDDSYVPYNREKYEKIKPPLSGMAEPFCLYVDQVRFIPDNATIIKVTGRFVQSGIDDEIKDISLFPDVETLPRSPMFRLSTRQVINQDRKLLFKNTTLLILRVYTVLKTNLEIVIIGNCIVPIFNEDGILLSGCFQKRLRNQQLDDLQNLTAVSLNDAPYIESCSILYRLWPYTKDPVKAPSYTTGCYQSDECEPTDFEWEIFDFYKKDDMLSKDLRDVVREIKFRDKNPEYTNEAVTHSFMMEYIPYRLDITKHLPENEAPSHFDSDLMFHYRIEKGIHFKVEQVFGVKDDMLLFTTAKVLRGTKTANKDPRPRQKYGVDEFVIFSELDFNSSAGYTKWNTSFQMIRPYFDEKALLVVQVWGIRAILINGEFCDIVTRKKIVKLTKEMEIGWTAIQLFKNGFVNTGKHQLPLFPTRLHLALLKRFQANSIPTTLQTEEQFQDLDGNSIILYLYDGHRSIEDYPLDLPLNTEIIDALPEKEAYLASLDQERVGKMVYELAIDLIENLEVDESKGQDKLSVFSELFVNLAKKLSTSIPPKQSYLPIFF